MNTAQSAALLALLQARFSQHMSRHEHIQWGDVLFRLNTYPEKVQVLAAMESSGGEPDVVGYDDPAGQIVFMDCSAETPIGRRSLCYDREALAARKENKPAGSALEQAAALGVELLNEHEYRSLQNLGEFDLKTSSWLLTPAAVREQGGALFGDRRYGQVFVYHNGAQSYYAARGYRGVLRV